MTIIVMPSGYRTIVVKLNFHKVLDNLLLLCYNT
nr:MAG TPA: hypothetical protein [Bacteriophage sp.]